MGEQIKKGYLVSQLIKKLQELPQEAFVCITDWNKNLHYSDGSEEGCHDGIYPDFSIDYETEGVSSPFVSLSFKNEDYTELGEKVE